MRFGSNLAFWLLLVGLLATACQQATGQGLDQKGVEFFESKVRPILISRCVECHGPEKQKANLRLDTKAGVTAGGDSGAVVVAGKPEESLLITAIGYSGDIKMPPKSKLPPAEIATLTEWVKLGAPWPTTEPGGLNPAASGAMTITAEHRAFWAFQAVADPAPPVVKQENWCQSPLDRFILAELEAKNLAPAPLADKRTLIRRATIDVIGVPPTPEEIEQFLSDASPDAFAKVVDRLLASPRYGERWGRHWLDVARYADSNGLDENLAYANAWRYRDYVVSAYNRDKPFDLFVQEQIAGDLLPDSGLLETQLERITATGFLCLGAKMLAEDDPVKMQMDIIDEQVDTIGKAFLGLTLGCARCHDHKFDPVSAEDYYSLAGIFKSTKTMENFSVVARWQERPLATPEAVLSQRQHQEKMTAKQAETSRIRNAAVEEVLKDERRHVGDYLLAVVESQRMKDLLAAAKPLGNDPQAASAPGAFLLEAESFLRGNVLKDTATYGTGIGVLVNKGELPNFTEYEITTPSARMYQFEIRLAAADARPCQLFINGAVVKTDAAGFKTGTWYPDTQKWGVEGFFSLKAGLNVIRLECAGPFPHIDKLLLSPVDLSLSSKAPDAWPVKADLVTQISEYLSKPPADPKAADLFRAVWGPWRIVTGAAVIPGEPTELQKQVADLFAKSLENTDGPTRIAQVSARYQEFFTAADVAWQERKAKDAGVQSLADPVQEAFRQLLYDPQGPFAPPKTIDAAFPVQVQAELKRLKDETAELEKTLPKLPETMAVSDAEPQNLKVHLRGSHLTLGKEVPRQFLRVLNGDKAVVDGKHSGRLELAQWLTRPEHPLTSRVMVNRVWQGHFGEGLVRSPDNFGRLGERPTHPALLDWLSKRFIESGWSLKQLHRLIMLSSTYQMSSRQNSDAWAVDPDNRLWWRFNRRRMEVEAIRDSILAAAGTLDGRMGGSQLPTPNRAYVTSTANVNPVAYEGTRRSIYLPVVRSALFDVFQAFDFAEPSVENGRRETTTVAPQALFMMNSAFVSEHSLALADALLARSELDDAARVRQAWELTLGKAPSEVLLKRTLEYLDRTTLTWTGRQVSPVEARRRAWQSVCRTLFGANEFVYVD